MQPGAEAPMGLDTRGKPLQVPCSGPGRAGCWPGDQLRLEGGGGNRGAERPCSALCVRASRLGCVTPRQRDKAASSYFPSLSSSQEPSRPREHSPAPKAAGRTVATLSRLLSWPRAHGSPLSSWLRAWVAGLVTQAGTRAVHAHSHVHTRTQPPVPHPLPPVQASGSAQVPWPWPQHVQYCPWPGGWGSLPRIWGGTWHRLLSSSGPQGSPQMPQAPQQWPRVFS